MARSQHFGGRAADRHAQSRPVIGKVPQLLSDRIGPPPTLAIAEQLLDMLRDLAGLTGKAEAEIGQALPIQAA